jgi:hypothetical protein
MTTPDPIFDPLRRTVNRELVRHAAATAVFCPHCGAIMDMASTVLVSASHGRHWVGCAACWGRGPFQMDAGAWSVLDGRILFARAPRAPRARRARAVRP